MNSPKEKAKELIDKFYQEAPLDEIKFYSNDVMAKSCALIAINELIYETQFEVPNIRQKYWINVKHEINKL
jgi:hypothetical protein